MHCSHNIPTSPPQCLQFPSGLTNVKLALHLRYIWHNICSHAWGCSVYAGMFRERGPGTAHSARREKKATKANDSVLEEARTCSWAVWQVLLYWCCEERKGQKIRLGPRGVGLLRRGVDFTACQKVQKRKKSWRESNWEGNFHNCWLAVVQLVSTASLLCDLLFGRGHLCGVAWCVTVEYISTHATNCSITVASLMSPLYL